MIDLSCFNWVQLVKKSDLPANAKYLALYLGTFMNFEQDIAWPSQMRISNETGLSKPTVIKWLAYLDQSGWIIKRNRMKAVETAGGVQMRNEYLINVPEKVVKKLNDLHQGGKSDDERGLNESPKGVKQFNTNNNINNNINNICSIPFSDFWKVWPKKVDKVDAERAWNKLSDKDRKIAVADCATRYTETEKKFIPSPRKYLLKNKWTDERFGEVTEGKDYVL